MPQTLSGIQFQIKFEKAYWTAIDEFGRPYIKPKGRKLESMPDWHNFRKNLCQKISRHKKSKKLSFIWFLKQIMPFGSGL